MRVNDIVLNQRALPQKDKYPQAKGNVLNYLSFSISYMQGSVRWRRVV